MFFRNYGVIIKNAGESIEKVTNHGITLELLASYDGTEVIKQTLQTSSWWALGPEDGWNALEFLFVLSGIVSVNIENEKIDLRPGDYLKSLPIKDVLMIQAKETSELLYITSQPVFHNFSGTVDKIKKIVEEVEEKDGYTKDHCMRIMKLSMALGQKLGLSSHDLYRLNLASYLHDVGKIKIPDHILMKPGNLTEEEWSIIKNHPTYGKEILEETNLPLLVDAAKIVEQHHERYDGSGYPKGLKGDEIMIEAAIIAVADSYDAMTSDRVYRKAMSKERVIYEIIQGSGSLYHPDVVQAFLAII